MLYSTHSETLTCSCTQPVINYGTFVTIQYRLHEVCSSIFVTQEWISSLSMASYDALVFNDFRVTASYSFQALRTLCELVGTTIGINLDQYYSNQYVSVFVAPAQLFLLQMSARLDQLILSTKNSFMLPFSMIRNTIHNNGLFSSLQTNYRQVVQNNNLFSFPLQYRGCSCALSPTCVDQSAIYQDSNGTQLFSVPGFYTGCYIIESLLQSDLRCFYDQACINQLKTYLSSSMEVTALYSALSSRNFPNTTINQLLDFLMVQQWDTSISYEGYYDACQPKQCSFSIGTNETVETTEMKTEVITYIVGIVIGVIGGSITILNLIIPRLVKFIVYSIQKREINAIS